MALPSTTYDTAALVNPTISLTDFTLIVDLSRMSAAWWAAVDTSDGTKGRAAKDSGPTELACDWIDFDSVNETGLLRVKWSGTLSDTGTQTLRVYPPVAANASVSASDTYGSDNAYDADWAAYWPLHDLLDRTANSYDLTAQIAMGAIGGESGKIGAATDFPGVNNGRLEYTAGRIHDGPGATQIAWVNFDVANVASIINADGVSGYQRLLYVAGGFNAQEWDGTTVASQSNSTTLTLGSWFMVTGQFVTTTSRFAWTNKNKAGPRLTNVSSLNESTQVGIGQNVGGGTAINGKMQHIQMHSAARADEWIEYEYDQTNNQSTFWGTWTNVETGGGGSGLWTPAELGASLALWLDADDAATISLNGSTVSNWNDKSGNNRHVSQATATAQPTYLSVGFSGKPSLRTDGSDSLEPGITSLGRNVGGLTAAIVGMYPVGATFNSNACDIIIYTANTGGTRLYLGPNPSVSTANRYAVAGRRLDTDAFATVSSTTDSLANSGTPWIRIGNRDYSGGVANHFTNGTQDLTNAVVTTQGAGNTSDTDSVRTVIFGGVANVPPNTELSEIVVTHSTLSTADRQKLEGYLAWKWGLEANLPVDHPYKGAAPITENGISIPVVMHHRRMMGVS